ncbi:MAG: ribosomal protein S18-alanine N-acetyltransferase [Acidimicrobiia bacterium]|nr:ribosomal protein S18-alanine N-acetyltransferase [Acidimicrobiia bacterium]
MNDCTVLQVRELVASDLDDVARIETAANASPWSRALFEGELSMNPTERLWLVGSLGGEIVGFTGAMFIGDDVHIMNVAVDPGVRRRGFARLLLAELLGRSAGIGARNATLEVRESNKSAIALYRRFGLGPVGIRGGYYSDGEDALILWAHVIDSPEYSDRLHRLGDRSGEVGG